MYTNQGAHNEIDNAGSPEDEDISELIGECGTTDSDVLADNLSVHLTDEHNDEQMEQDELLEDYISDSFSEHEGISDIYSGYIAAQYSMWLYY